MDNWRDVVHLPLSFPLSLCEIDPNRRTQRKHVRGRDNGVTTCRPGAWKEDSAGDAPGRGGNRENKGDGERGGVEVQGGFSRPRI